MMNLYEQPAPSSPNAAVQQCEVDIYNEIPPTIDELAELDENLDPRWLTDLVRSFAVN